MKTKKEKKQEEPKPEPKKTYYQEAMRYIENAKDDLKKAKIQKDGIFYDDVKYVKSAAGIAYAGVEQAAKWFLKLNGFTEKFTNSEQIVDGLRKINKKAKEYFNSCYVGLHMAIYYQNEKKIKVVKEALNSAVGFIAFLKPYNKEFVYSKGGTLKTKKSPTKKAVKKIIKSKQK